MRDESLGLRERKRLRTRRRLEQVALDLFEANGFTATTVDAIAAAADIAPRTYLHYFATKEDLVLADFAERLGRVNATLAERPPDEPPWEALRAAFQAVAADYEQQRHELLRRFTIMAESPSVLARSLQVQAGWEGTVADTLAGRMKVDPHQDPRPGLAAATALAALRSALRLWLLDRGRHDLPARLDQCFDLLDAGMHHLDSRPSVPPRERSS